MTSDKDWFYYHYKVAEEVSKNLSSLKEVLCGTGDKEPQTEAVAQLAQELYNTNLLIALIANLQKIDFEVGRMYNLPRTKVLCLWKYWFSLQGYMWLYPQSKK